MKIYRVRDDNHRDCLTTSDDGEVFFRLAGDPFYGEHKITNERVNVQSLMAPVEPAAIYCLGINYREHAEETKSELPSHPIVFMKAPSAVQDPDANIVLPRFLKSESVDFEGELGVIIGYPAKNVKKEEALKYVLGYTIANDVSARDWQIKHGGGQWCRGKTFDTFCPLGPCLATPPDVQDPNALKLETRVNGEVMQSANTADMIFKVAEVIEFLSGSTTLEAGTVILTGTPSGVGMARHPKVFLKEGDTVEIEIENIGTLRNTVIEEKVVK